MPLKYAVAKHEIRHVIWASYQEAGVTHTCLHLPLPPPLKEKKALVYSSSLCVFIGPCYYERKRSYTKAVRPPVKRSHINPDLIASIAPTSSG